MNLWADRHAICTCTLVCAALILGGGGSPAPLFELALQLFAVLALSVWVFTGSREKYALPREVVVLIGLVTSVPLLQLVPLPPSVWQNLPGRESATAALTLVGTEQSWRPLSLVPHRTFAALLSLGPPTILLVMTANLPVQSRSIVLRTIALVGVTSVVLGGLQLTGGGHAFRFYDDTHHDWLTGFQANRNAAADVLLVAILALAASVNGRPGPATLIGIALMALGVVLTGSRAGIALMLPTLLLIGWRIAGSRSVHKALLWLGGMASAVLLAAIATAQIPVLRDVLSRFNVTSDARVPLWEDSWIAAMAYWPVGGGVGGFSQLILPFEALAHVDPTVPNRAHNDYLEWLIEAGLPGLIVLALAIAVLVALIIRSCRCASIPAGHRLFAIGSLAIIAAHSIVDYPLRSMSLACLLAVAVGAIMIPRYKAAEKGIGA